MTKRDTIRGRTPPRAFRLGYPRGTSEDHTRCCNIAVDHEAAGTRMDSLRKLLGLDRSTRRTFSAGIAGVNLDKLRSGTFRLVLKLIEEYRPPSIVNALCHASASKTLDVQILDCDQAVLAHDRGRVLMTEVSPLSRDPFVLTTNADDCLPPSPTSLCTSAHSALKCSQSSLRASKEARRFDCAPIRESRKRSQSHVDAGFGAIMLDGRCFDINKHLGIPTRCTPNDPQQALLCRNGAPPATKSNQTQLGNVQQVLGSNVSAWLEILHRVEACGGLESREPCLTATRLGPTKSEGGVYRPRLLP